MPTRPSLLVASSHQLETPATEIGKPVNLISFTPATAFPGGSRTGTALESGTYSSSSCETTWD